MHHHIHRGVWVACVAAISLLAYSPIASAHHMSPADPEIGDMRGMHESVINERLASGTGFNANLESGTKAALQTGASGSQARNERSLTQGPSEQSGTATRTSDRARMDAGSSGSSSQSRTSNPMR